MDVSNIWTFFPRKIQQFAVRCSVPKNGRSKLKEMHGIYLFVMQGILYYPVATRLQQMGLRSENLVLTTGLLVVIMNHKDFHRRLQPSPSKFSLASSVRAIYRPTMRARVPGAR